MRNYSGIYKFKYIKRFIKYKIFAILFNCVYYNQVLHYYIFISKMDNNAESNLDILFLGIDNAGKSSLLSAMRGDYNIQ